jgi:hypothetical protein
LREEYGETRSKGFAATSKVNHNAAKIGPKNKNHRAVANRYTANKGENKTEKQMLGSSLANSAKRSDEILLSCKT